MPRAMALSQFICSSSDPIAHSLRGTGAILENARYRRLGYAGKTYNVVGRSALAASRFVIVIRSGGFAHSALLALGFRSEPMLGSIACGC